jgi:wyosine [tRNA(Phe)-imidazoG37] synthetase (radical SAM superfamily)
MRPGEVDKVAQILSDLRIELVNYFKLGEPFASPRIEQELEVIRGKNPETRIVLSTNGTLLNTDSKRRAALFLDELVFSIDGVDSIMADRYQKGADFDLAYENLRALVAFRDALGVSSPTIGWRYVVFRWNDRSQDVRRAQRLCEEAGADFLELAYARTPVMGISLRRFASRWHWLHGRTNGRWGTRISTR